MTESDIFETLRGALGDGVVASGGAGFDAWARVEPGRAREALELLKGRLGFNVLVDYTAADLIRWPGTHWAGVWDPCQATQGPAFQPRSSPEGRFELTWRLMRLEPSTGLVEARAALKCRVSEGKSGPPSMRDLWPCADWLEREVWDMFGVKPSDRPALKRMLLYEEFQGHPLRKDYPIARRQPLIEPLPAPRERIDPSQLRPKATP